MKTKHMSSGTTRSIPPSRGCTSIHIWSMMHYMDTGEVVVTRNRMSNHLGGHHEVTATLPLGIPRGRGGIST